MSDAGVEGVGDLDGDCADAKPWAARGDGEGGDRGGRAVILRGKGGVLGVGGGGGRRGWGCRWKGRTWRRSELTHVLVHKRLLDAKKLESLHIRRIFSNPKPT